LSRLTSQDDNNEQSSRFTNTTRCTTIGWKSRKLIARTISPTRHLRSSQPKGHPPTHRGTCMGKFGGEYRLVGKSGVLEHKAATSLKRVKIEEKLLQRYHPRPPTASSSTKIAFEVRKTQCHPPKTAIAIISGTGKATKLKFCTLIQRIDRNRCLLKISGKVAVGVLSLDSRIFSTPIYRAHRAVIFAIAQLSCLVLCDSAEANAGGY